MKNTTSQLAMAAALATGLAGGMAAPALADVDVTVTITKDKTITVTETISITKTVDIIAGGILNLDGAAEAQALANIRNENNNVTYNDDEAGDVDFSAVLDASVLTQTGITGVNQDAGYAAKQGNVVALGIADSGDAFVNAQAEADQINRGHRVLEGPAEPPFPPAVADPNANPPWTVIYSATISGSINGLAPLGVVGVNQNAGNNNSQLNMVALAVGLDDDAAADEAVALAEAALGQQNGGPEDTSNGNGGNRVTESGTYKNASILGSLNNNLGGVIGANQAAGNNANQANLVSFAAFVAP